MNIDDSETDIFGFRYGFYQGCTGIVLENCYSGPLTITGHIALEKAAWFAGDGETVVELEDDTPYCLPDTGVICIDTGCGKGGRLTAMVIDGDEYTLMSVDEQGMP